MAKATYVQAGKKLDYPNGTGKTINAGDVITLKTRVGVAASDILPGDVGVVCMEGAFRMPKTGNSAIEMGATVYFDGTGITNTASSNTPAGYAAAAAAAADTEILVNLMG